MNLQQAIAELERDLNAGLHEGLEPIEIAALVIDRHRIDITPQALLRASDTAAMREFAAYHEAQLSH